MTERAYIALGANLGATPEANRATLRGAIAALVELPTTNLIAQSSFYRTAPLGYNDQPDFVNAVISIDTAIAPQALLLALHGIEERFGRVRSFQNAPRTLDLDLLCYGARFIATATLTVPHPRLHERAFVLAPLVEIAPDLDIPGHGRVDQLLARLPDQRIVRLRP
ncbi:MAG: 2-amino-4-hydroxy-6-hydroxymethyldihydropteridine diphosphokinase [Burkholderiales bacterium]